MEVLMVQFNVDCDGQVFEWWGLWQGPLSGENWWTVVSCACLALQGKLDQQGQSVIGANVGLVVTRCVVPPEQHKVVAHYFENAKADSAARLLREPTGINLERWQTHGEV